MQIAVLGCGPKMGLRVAAEMLRMHDAVSRVSVWVPQLHGGPTIEGTTASLRDLLLHEVVIPLSSTQAQRTPTITYGGHGSHGGGHGEYYGHGHGHGHGHWHEDDAPSTATQYSPPTVDDLMTRASITHSIAETMRDCKLVVEAITEDLGIKQNTFAQIDSIAPPDCLFTTCTINLNVDEIRGGCSVHRDRFIGMRFLYPVMFIPMVELTKTAFTSEVVFQQAVGILHQLGKTHFVWTGTGNRTFLHTEKVDILQRDAMIAVRKASSPSTGMHPESVSHASLVVSEPATTAATPQENNPCSVCLDRQKDCVLIPCGHRCCCFQCTASLSGKCPICRAPFQSVVKVYDS